MKNVLKTALCICFFLSLVLPAAAYDAEEVVGTNRDLLAGANEPGSRISGTPLGCALAEAARAAGGTEIAVVAGGDIAGNLVGGEITWGYLTDALTEDRPLGTAEITPAQLKDLLEAGCANITVDENDAVDREASQSDAFAQPAGFTYEIDGSAPAGERIRKIRLTGGGLLDLEDNETKLTLTASLYMLSGGYGTEELPSSPLDLTLAEAAAQSLAAGTFGTEDTGKVSFVGTTDVRIIDYFPVGIVVLIGVLLGLFRYKHRAVTEMTRDNTEMEKGYEKKSVRDLYRQ